MGDNGKAAEIADYLSKDKKERGLKILKRKIEAIAKLNMKTEDIETPFVIEPIPDISTTIKFIFPYEDIKSITS